MDTKLKGDIAEQKVILKILEKGWNVSVPIGDRLPYDLVIDVERRLLKIQVKSAWYEKNRKCWVVGTRRVKTNRKAMKIERYSNSDFDFAILYVGAKEVFYIMPVEIFNSYKSTITLESIKNKKAKAYPYKDAWNLLTKP